MNKENQRQPEQAERRDDAVKTEYEPPRIMRKRLVSEVTKKTKCPTWPKC